jgi:hypothetical protein
MGHCEGVFVVSTVCGVCICLCVQCVYVRGCLCVLCISVYNVYEIYVCVKHVWYMYSIPMCDMYIYVYVCAIYIGDVCDTCRVSGMYTGWICNVCVTVCYVYLYVWCTWNMYVCGMCDAYVTCVCVCVQTSSLSLCWLLADEMHGHRHTIHSHLRS